MCHKSRKRKTPSLLHCFHVCYFNLTVKFKWFAPCCGGWYHQSQVKTKYRQITSLTWYSIGNLRWALFAIKKAWLAISDANIKKVSAVNGFLSQQSIASRAVSLVVPLATGWRCKFEMPVRASCFLSTVFRLWRLAQNVYTSTTWSANYR